MYFYKNKGNCVFLNFEFFKYFFMSLKSKLIYENNYKKLKKFL